MKIGKILSMVLVLILASAFLSLCQAHAMNRPGGPEAWTAVEKTENDNMKAVLQGANREDLTKDPEIVTILANFAAGRSDQTKTEAALKSKNIDLSGIAEVGGLLDNLRPGGISSRITTAQMDADGTPGYAAGETLASNLVSLNNLSAPGTTNDRVLTATETIINDSAAAAEIYQHWSTGDYDYLSVGITDEAQEESLRNKILGSGIDITEEQIMFSQMNNTLVIDLTQQVQELLAKGTAPSLQSVRDLATAK
ncbi:MAG: hypothetical protein KKG01_01405 [Candidatus Omnitrophica bacterium]|nr:hypothetical protein [Candidatus Omnitrophota bacterium]